MQVQVNSLENFHIWLSDRPRLLTWRFFDRTGLGLQYGEPKLVPMTIQSSDGPRQTCTMLLEVILAIVIACFYVANHLRLRANNSAQGQDYWKQRGIKYVAKYAEYKNRQYTLKLFC